MKIKYYLRGLGTGILISAIVVIVAGGFRNEGSNEKATENASTKSMIEYVTDSGSTKAENTTKNAETTKAETTKAETTKAQSTELTKGETKVETKEATKEEVPTEAPTKESFIEDGKEYKEVDLSDAYSSEQVAEILEREGIITSADEFNEFLYAHEGYATSMHTGIFRLYVGQSFESIAEILITI